MGEFFILKTRIQPPPISRPQQTHPEPDSAPNPGDRLELLPRKSSPPKNAKTSSVLQRTHRLGDLLGNKGQNGFIFAVRLTFGKDHQ